MLFPPPDAPAGLYPGQVMHARMKPRTHRFAYEVAALLIDLDRLDEADRISPLFAVGRRAAVSFRPTDHGAGDDDLRAHVDGLLAKAGLPERAARVLLLCYPRWLGYAFNPLAVYYAYAGDGTLAAVIYEVRNTFGERHTYVARVENGELSEAGLRQERAKLFYVSPFLGQAMRYRFRLRPPGETLAVRILETDAEGPILSASFFGRREGLTSRNLARALLRMPLMTVKVMAAIHWEAARLWLKGIKFHARPAAPVPFSLRDGVLPAPDTEVTR
jgi:DUF1365 family protein